MKKLSLLITMILAVYLYPIQQVKAQDLASDSLALVALYDSCGGANWVGFETWKAGNLSTWKDVTVTDGRVTHVLFSGMTLTGKLPAALGNLTTMAGKIELNNQPGLTGTLPAFIWNWTGVERLQVKFCGFDAIDVTGIEAMVNLYEFNSQGTPFTGEVPAALFNLPLMRDVYLEDSKWTGLAADMPIPTPTPLRRFYLNGNEFTNLPDLTGMVWAEGTKIKIRDNMLTFEDIVPNMSIKDNVNVSAFEYSPQGPIGMDKTVEATIGGAVTLESNIGGSATTVYTWIKGIDEVVGDTKDLSIASFDPAQHAGTYFCLGQDPSAAGLDIMSGKMTLQAPALVMDSLALVALYDSCGGANWVGFETWKAGNLSTWKDVTVTDGRVTHVQFKDMTLSGKLPAALGNLTAMAGKIELNNQPGLTGTLPAFIWNWTGVERLQVKFCGFDAIDVTGIEAMVNLYEFNSQATPFTGEVPAALFNLPLMRDVYLEDSKWTGLAADMPIPTPTPLRRFYLNGNQIIDLPNLTGMVWAEGAKIKFRNNMLTFEDLESNMWIKDDANVSAFEISPQALLSDKDTVTLDEKDVLEITVNCGGSQNAYTWIKDGEVLDNVTTNVLKIDEVTVSDAGDYQCLVQSTLVPGLDLVSDTVTVTVKSSAGINEARNNTITVLGNPMDNVLAIDAQQVIEMVAVYNLSGSLVKQAAVNAKSLRLDVSDLNKGMYVVSLRSANAETIVKVIKE